MLSLVTMMLSEPLSLLYLQMADAVIEANQGESMEETEEADA